MGSVPAAMGTALHRLIGRAEGSPSVGKVAEGIVAGLAPRLGEGKTPEILHGTWLGHSAHPFFTDFPEGAWMAASFLDLFGPDGSDRPAQRLVGFGLLAAVPTALTGFADWAHSDGDGPGKRRSGLIHAVSSTLVTTLYAASYIARRRNRRAAGVALGVAGGVLATMDGWVGGHLSLGRGAGVSRIAFYIPPREWTAVSIDTDHLVEGNAVPAISDGMDILLLKTGDDLIAVAGRCSFDGAVLAPGPVEDGAIRCTAHGCTFRLLDGAVLRGPASVPQTMLEARVIENRIEVKATEKPPGMPRNQR